MGRERGDLERVRFRCAEGGSVWGVVDAIVVFVVEFGRVRAWSWTEMSIELFSSI